MVSSSGIGKPSGRKAARSRASPPTVGGGGALVTGELVPGGCIGVVVGAVVVPVVAGDSLGLAVVATVPVGDSAGRRGSVSSEHADTEMVSASARAEV